MARKSKPYLRKQTKSWYCSGNGKQVSLGKDKEMAFQKFRELMANKDSLDGAFSTLYELLELPTIRLSPQIATSFDKYWSQCLKLKSQGWQVRIQDPLM